jgi:hypothetical protein
LGSVEQLRACYEACPTGYVLYWQLSELGVECVVIAPTLAPVRAGDRVRTSRLRFSFAGISSYNVNVAKPRMIRRIKDAESDFQF